MVTIIHLEGAYFNYTSPSFYYWSMELLIQPGSFTSTLQRMLPVLVSSISWTVGLLWNGLVRCCWSTGLPQTTSR